MLARYSLLPSLLLACSLAGTSILAQQSTGSSANRSQDTTAETPSAPLAPTRRQMVHDYVLDTVGPYPIMMASFTAAIHQGTDNPPEWRQGAEALAERFGSNMGITAVANTTRLGLALALDQNTAYFHCRCNGWLPRLRHAGISALIARRRSDGRQVFSIPNLVATYAATMTATYAWYPQRYGAKDAFRMGNYNLLGTVGSDIAFEFIPQKVWHALGRFHLSSRRMANRE